MLETVQDLAYVSYGVIVHQCNISPSSNFPSAHCLSCQDKSTTCLLHTATFQVHTVCPVKTKAPHVSSVYLAFLFDKWKESLNPHSNFEKLLDSNKPHQLFQVGQHYANEWEEFQAHEALHFSCQGEFAKELFPNNFDFANCATQKDVPSWTDVTMVEEKDGLFSLLLAVTITQVLQDISLELKKLPVQLP